MNPVAAERVVSRPRIEYLVDRPDLLDRVAQMHQREWGHLHPQVSLAERLALLRACSGRGGVSSVFLAINDKDGLLGTASLVEQEPGARNDLSPWLAGVFVRAHYRLRGVATQLVKSVIETARANGIEALYLHTRPGLEPFYQHRGWTRFATGEQRGDQTVIMRRALREAHGE